MAGQAKIRFDFTEDATRELYELQRLVHLSDEPETIRHALRFLRWAVDETMQGGTLCIQKNDRIRKVIPFWKTNSNSAN